MAAFFCDSGSIIKRYVNESGSNFVDGLADSNSGGFRNKRRENCERTAVIDFCFSRSELNTAAQAEVLTVENPNDYP